MIIKNVKVFDKKNIGFNISNSTEELIGVIENAPIISTVNNVEEVVGVVAGARNEYGVFIGNIYIFPRYTDLQSCSVSSQEIQFENVGENTIRITYLALHVVPKSLDKSQSM